MAQQVTKDERSLGDLFSELASETGTLVRQEVALAQAELTQKAAKVGRNVGYLVVGGAVAYAALLALLTAFIIGLGTLIGYGFSALIVGIVIAIAAAILIMSALNALKNTDIAPRQTVETIKEDVKWLKDQVS
ncbi:MAG: phage holin family protein [Pyrinomonadaceae bacterium]